MLARRPLSVALDSDATGIQLSDAVGRTSSDAGVPHDRAQEDRRMHRDEMLSLFQQHRKAEATRDFDAIMATFVEDCYLETVPLNLRIEGRTAARAAYEGYFTAFPDLSSRRRGLRVRR
jgi:hypothetical protein